MSHHVHDWDAQHASGHEPRDEDAARAGELAGLLAGLAQHPHRALDLGCGTGVDAVFLAARGIDTTGVDLSPVALEQARQRAAAQGVEVEWLHADVLQLPLDDACVDLVLDRGCLHHVATDDQPRYAAEVARVLRPGGTLLVRELNVAGHHEHAVSEGALAAMVEDTPLRIRSIVTYATERGGRRRRTMLATFDR